MLLATIFLTPNGPDATASPEKVVAFARHNQTGLYLSAYLISLAVLIAGAFIWYLRDVVAPSEPGRRLADLGFRWRDPLLGRRNLQRRCGICHGRCRQARRPSRAANVEIFTQDVSSIAGGATALLLGATSLAILRSKALPSWLAYVGLVLAVASFAIPMLGLPVVALWWLLTSIVVLVTSKESTVTGKLASSV